MPPQTSDSDTRLAPRSAAFARALPAYLVALAFGLMGAFLLWSSGRHLLLYHGSPLWPSVTGKMVSSEIISQAGKSDNRKEYGLKLAYIYSVNAHVYSGTKLGVSPIWTRERSEIEALAKAWPVNTQLRVYHHPQTPNIALLIPGADASSYGILISGLILVFVGQASLLLRKPQQAPSPEP